MARPQISEKPSVAAKPRLKALLLPPKPAMPDSSSILSMPPGESPLQNYNKNNNNKLNKFQNCLIKSSCSTASKVRPVNHVGAISSETQLLALEKVSVRSSEPLEKASAQATEPLEKSPVKSLEPLRKTSIRSSEPLEKTPARSSEPPPLPSLPPPIQRRGPLSTVNSMTLPASFRNRNINENKLQTSPTINSLTPSTPSLVSSSRSTRSLVRNVSPPSRPSPVTAPKPHNHTSPHIFVTASETLPNAVQRKDSRVIRPVTSDTPQRLLRKCVLTEPKTDSQKNHSPSVSPRTSPWPSEASRKPTSTQPQPTNCPETLPSALSKQSSLGIKPMISTKPSGNCRVQTAKKDTQATDVKSPVKRTPSAPPPLPMNPPRAGPLRKSRSSASEFAPSFETKPELEVPEQALNCTLPAHSFAVTTSTPKVTELGSNTQACTFTRMGCKQSITEKIHMLLHKNENFDTELSGSVKSNTLTASLGTSQRTKPLTNITDSELSVAETPPKPMSRSRGSPLSTESTSNKVRGLNGSSIDQNSIGRNSTTSITRGNVRSGQGHHGDDVDSSYRGEKHLFRPDENISHSSKQAPEKTSRSVQNTDELIKKPFAVCNSENVDSVRTRIADDFSSLFRDEPEETSDMLKEIEEMLKNKLGDTEFGIQNTKVFTSSRKYSEECSAGNRRKSYLENTSDHRLSNSSFSSPSRSKHSLSTDVGSLQSLDISSASSSFECLASAGLPNAGSTASLGKKVTPQKPKRTFLHRVSQIQPDATSLKLDIDMSDVTAFEGYQQQEKPYYHYLETLSRNELEDSCPPLPPRNKPRSASLQEVGGTAPLISKRSSSMNTENSGKSGQVVAGSLNISQPSQVVLEPTQPGAKICSPTKKMQRSRPSREALPPPPPGPPKRSATFSPGDGNQSTTADQIGQTDASNIQGTVASLASHLLKKSSSLLLHRQPNFEVKSQGCHEIPGSARNDRDDRRLSEASQQSTGSEHEGNGKLFETQNVEEIVSSGTDTESEEDKEEIYVRRKAKKVFFIAKEIMSSENTFVDVLRLLNLDFRTHISRMTEKLGHPVLPTETLNKILDFLPQLQNLNEDLLKDLKGRIEKWDTNPRLSDIFIKKGPFLKLYSSYIRNFENASAILEDACKKNSAFVAAVREFEMSPRCARLALKHYMLKPIQRIPQYKLLLQDYLKHLTEASPDYKDTITALNIVSEVADHANDSMRHGDNLQKLLEVQRSLIGQFEVIQPGRVLLKQGELQKLSRREMQPRMFFLFTDVLLYTTPTSTGYKINNILPLIGMKIISPKLEDYKFEFYIISVQRSFSLCASSYEEKEQWVSALETSIEDNAKKHHTFQAVKQGLQTSLQDKDFVLGYKAPLWVPDARVTMCMLCLLEFTLTLRRHHCRSCGRVVCFHCSENRAPLRYLKYEPARVCDSCFDKLRAEMTSEFERSQGKKIRPDLPQVEDDSTASLPERAAGEIATTEMDREEGNVAGNKHIAGLGLHSIMGRFQKMKKSNRDRRRPNNFRPSVLKEVRANDEGSDMCGYLHAFKSRKWKRLWFVVKGKVLYTYKASEDMAASESMPLLGYEVTRPNAWFEGCKSDLLFELSHQNNQPLNTHKEGQRSYPRGTSGAEKTTQRLIFRTDSASALDKWVAVLREASVTYN